MYALFVHRSHWLRQCLYERWSGRALCSGGLLSLTINYPHYDNYHSAVLSHHFSSLPGFLSELDDRLHNIQLFIILSPGDLNDNQQGGISSLLHRARLSTLGHGNRSRRGEEKIWCCLEGKGGDVRIDESSSRSAAVRAWAWQGCKYCLATECRVFMSLVPVSGSEVISGRGWWSTSVSCFSSLSSPTVTGRHHT